MKNFFANVWTKRVVAIVSVLYAMAVCRLCYLSIFYDIHIHTRTSLCLVISAVSVVTLVAMLYTRKQILTRLSSFIILPAMLPVVLLYFGEWGMIIPIIITGIVILLLSGSGEGAKTAIATVILLLYIFGALGYFLFTSFFVASAKETVVESGVSPSGRYRYRVVNTEDSSNGSTTVYVEPNDADLNYSTFVTFTLKDMERIVVQERPICENIEIQWDTQTRQEITSILNGISDSISVSLTVGEMEKLGYTYDEKLQLTDISTDKKFAIGKTASDVAPILLDTLTDDQLAVFGIGREASGRYYIISPSDELLDSLENTTGARVYFSEMDRDSLKLFNKENTDDYGNSLFTVSKNNTVFLNTLTDEQLEMIGVSESGDVMTFNGKTCFRYYVAELEDYYDVEGRHFSVDLLD